MVDPLQRFGDISKTGVARNGFRLGLRGVEEAKRSQAIVESDDDGLRCERQDGAFVEIVEGRVILEFPAVNEEEDGQGVV